MSAALDLRVFTPSAAGEATFFSMQIAAFLAQLRAQNNKIAQENAFAEGNITQALANANVQIANNEASATTAEAGASFAQMGSIVLTEVGGRVATHFYFKNQMGTAEETATTIKNNDQKIQEIENKPLDGDAVGDPVDDKSLKESMEKIKKGFDFTKPITKDFDEAIRASYQRAPRVPPAAPRTNVADDAEYQAEVKAYKKNYANYEQYKGFKEDLETQRTKNQKNLDNIEQSKDRIENHQRSTFSQLLTGLGQGVARTYQAQAQAANADQQYAKTYAEYLKQLLNTIDQMITGLGDSLERARQSLTQTLLGGLASANRA